MLRYLWFSYSLIFIPAVPAFATETDWAKDSEISSLPQYCQARLRKKHGSPEYKTWEGILGPNFVHTHHFCNGLNLINRYYKALNQYDRHFYLNAAIKEFDYMINHAAPTYSLMPEVYLNRGFALSKLHRDGEAIVDLMKALKLTPRSPRSYITLADFYADRKLTDKALATVTEGLKYIPKSNLLQRRYEELGGKQPFPEPYEQATAVVQPSTEKAEKALPAQSNEDSDATSKSKQKPTEPQQSIQQSQPAQPIGVPGNPWCRFCTDSDSKPQ
ncbi:MAG: tetratricopeptide repeat protein [Gallionella sp.]